MRMQMLILLAVLLNAAPLLAANDESPFKLELPDKSKTKPTGKDVESALKAALKADNVHVQAADKGMRAVGVVVYANADVIYVVPDLCAKKVDAIVFNQPCDREKTGETKQCPNHPDKKFELEAV